MRKRTFWHVRPTKTQISLRIRAVWSESSLSTLKNFASLAIQIAHSEDSDQTARMRSLIWIFTGRTCRKIRFLTYQLILCLKIGQTGNNARTEIMHKYYHSCLKVGFKSATLCPSFASTTHKMKRLYKTESPFPFFGMFFFFFFFFFFCTSFVIQHFEMFREQNVLQIDQRPSVFAVLIFSSSSVQFQLGKRSDYLIVKVFLCWFPKINGLFETSQSIGINTAYCFNRYRTLEIPLYTRKQPYAICERATGQISRRMRTIYSEHHPFVDTFYSFRWFGKRATEAQISLRMRAGLSGPTLPANGIIAIFLRCHFSTSNGILLFHWKRMYSKHA